LVDTGADTSLLKGNRLIWTVEYSPEKKVKVKYVDRSPVETHRTVEAKIKLKNSSIPHEFQLVNRQLDIPRDGILGHDFLQQVGAKICYESQTVELNGESCRLMGKVKESGTGKEEVKQIELIELPPRTESVVRLLVSLGSPPVRVTDKCEVQEGVIIAASLTKVRDGYVMTGVINTRRNEVEMQKPVVDLDEFDPTWDVNHSTGFAPQNREKDIIAQLRLEHLNFEEKKVLIQTCLDYQDIFYLPGDKLSSGRGTALNYYRTRD
jgi:hypothetical protein